MNDEKVLKYHNKRARVVFTPNKKGYSNTLNMIGTIENCSSGTEVGVKLDEMYNDSSSKGLFWFKLYQIELLNEEKENVKLEGNYKIAVVNLCSDYNKKDYGFALYDYAQEGDLVIVNTQNTYNVGVVKSILTKEEYGKSVTNEIIGAVDIKSYNERVKERERLAEIEKEKRILQSKLDAKIKQLKDAEYYERMAQELSDKDPEIVAMASRLKELMN